MNEGGEMIKEMQTSDVPEAHSPSLLLSSSQYWSINFLPRLSATVQLGGCATSRPFSSRQPYSSLGFDQLSWEFPGLFPSLVWNSCLRDHIHLSYVSTWHQMVLTSTSNLVFISKTEPSSFIFALPITAPSINWWMDYQPGLSQNSWLAGPKYLQPQPSSLDFPRQIHHLQLYYFLIILQKAQLCKNTSLFENPSLSHPVLSGKGQIFKQTNKSLCSLDWHRSL